MTERVKCIEFFQLKSGTQIVETIEQCAGHMDIPLIEKTTPGPDSSGEPDEQTQVQIQLPGGMVYICPDQIGQFFIHSAPYQGLTLYLIPESPELYGKTETFSLICRDIKRAVDGQEVISKPKK